MDQAVCCYRHPDRETGIRCARCERPVCPECMVNASVGFQCPECVRDAARTTPQPRTLAGGALRSDSRLVTKILIGLNLAVFLVVLSIGDRLVNQLMLIGYASDQGRMIGVADGEWYRLLTAMFLHQQYMHIGFNMLSLWWIGPPLEAALGRSRYLALYLLSGLAGGALAVLTAAGNQGSLGASGAVFGLFGATVVLMRRMRYDMKPILILLALNLFFTFTWPNIDWRAHIGGLAAGVMIAFGMVHAPRDRRALVQWGTCGVVLVVAIAMAWVGTLRLTG